MLAAYFLSSYCEKTWDRSAWSAAFVTIWSLLGFDAAAVVVAVVDAVDDVPSAPGPFFIGGAVLPRAFLPIRGAMTVLVALCTTALRLVANKRLQSSEPVYPCARQDNRDALHFDTSSPLCAASSALLRPKSQQ